MRIGSEGPVKVVSCQCVLSQINQMLLA